MDWLPINLDLLKNPLNWFTVFFMVILPLAALALISERLAPQEDQQFTTAP